MSRRSFCLSLAVVLLAGLLCVPVAAKSPKGRENTPVYYLSLGTSLAAGVQADPLTGQNVMTDVSYPRLLAEIIGADIKKLRHENLGCPLETSDTFIVGGLCKYPHGSQLDEALKFLHAHGKFTGLITIDLGANDVLACIQGPEIDRRCFRKAIVRLLKNLTYTLETLREAAGPDVPIVGMNYYNPLLVYWFQDPAIAEQTVKFQQQLNGTLEAVYAAFGVPVADVAGVFMVDDLETDVIGYDGGPNGIPDSVDLLCAWTWMCEVPNIHANDDGYAVIADEFAGVLPPIRISNPPRRR